MTGTLHTLAPMKAAAHDLDERVDAWNCPPGPPHMAASKSITIFDTAASDTIRFTDFITFLY